MFFACPGIKQRHVAELVDQTRHAAGDLMDKSHRVFGELVPGAAHGAQPVHDEGGGGVTVQRFQMEADRNALGKLFKVGLTDHVAQFRLADQHQLHHLVLAGVDVGQHPQFFKAFLRQVLRLVKDQKRAPAGGIFGDHEILHRLEQMHIAGIVVKALPQRVQNPLDQRAAPALGIRDQRHRQRVVQL